VGTYPVLWQPPGGRAHLGHLQFGPRGLALHGGNRGDESRLVVPYGDIFGARRTRTSLGPFRAIELDVRDVGTVFLATLDGDGRRREILETLQRLAVAVA
jgi:hypothetical protein